MIKYYVPYHAKILFIGINPHYGSFRRGVPFSNNKSFWYLLNSSGIIDETREELKNDTKLKKIYLNKFSNIYHLGLLNIVDRPSRDVSELRNGEEIIGRQRIIRVIRNKVPKVVCFIGKITFQKFIGKKAVEFGWQYNLFNSRVFVMHFPIRGKAAIRIKELNEVAGIAR
jgi:TDG/mug DNA glycosylase family protein